MAKDTEHKVLDTRFAPGPIPISKNFTGILGSGKTDSVGGIQELIERGNQERERKRLSDEQAKKQVKASTEANQNLFGGEFVNNIVNQCGFDYVQEKLGEQKDENKRKIAARMETARQVYKQVCPNSETGFLELDIEVRKQNGSKTPTQDVLKRIPTDIKLQIVNALPLDTDE